MELKLTLLLLSAMLLVELSIQRPPKAGGPKARAARNGIKLCGDNLKRAIVSSCGASRWKREAMDPPLPEMVQTGSNKVPENMKLQSDPELKEPQEHEPQDKELSWSDFVAYYENKNTNIPEAKEYPAWNSADLENEPELKQVQSDHPPDTEPSWRDFTELYNDNKEYIAAGAEDGGWKSPEEKELANPTGSDFPQAKVKRKRDLKLEMAIKCCSVGCSSDEIFGAFCSK